MARPVSSRVDTSSAASRSRVSLGRSGGARSTTSARSITDPGTPPNARITAAITSAAAARAHEARPALVEGCGGGFIGQDRRGGARDRAGGAIDLDIQESTHPPLFYPATSPKRDVLGRVLRSRGA